MKRVLFILSLCLFAAAGVSAQAKNRLISDVQGKGLFSAYVREQARLTGIVTARVANGFYLQTPDDKVDGDPATSEGIFVFTQSEPVADAAVGNLVSVTGTVAEYVPRQDELSLPTTQISMRRGSDFVTVIAKAQPLPKPVVLTMNDFLPNSLGQLEKYEGMRVTAPEVTVVAPTGGRVDDATGVSTSNGVFYGVLKGFARPFREIGFDDYDFSRMDDKEQEKMRKQVPGAKLFDHNPERIRIESAAQSGAQAIEVPAYAEMKNVTGVVGYAYRAYSILLDPDAKPVVSNITKATPFPPTGARDFMIANMNLENFFDDEDDPSIKEPVYPAEVFERRLKKVSTAVRLYMQTPEVIGIEEMESLAVLKKLAERINKDAEASGKPNPKYEAYVADGNDSRGIDSGFLVKSSRVEVIETKQFGKDEKFQSPTTKEDAILNDRPPLLMRLAVKDPEKNSKLELTLIVNHLKSLNGYNDPKDAPFVRLKKKLQAEYLAKLVAERLKANPDERIGLIGDFNAFQFNDGITDVIGTIKGAPAPKDAVLYPSDDLLNPDLVDLVDVIREQNRYSFVFDGNAQVLDHFIVTESFRKYVKGLAYARLNADYPDSYRNDASRVERFTDHDIPLALMTLDGKP